jgi:poly-gamma-glutamate capsule biosynthesis protein CapA/YwtB (metallophosphatase superfamily)
MIHTAARRLLTVIPLIVTLLLIATSCYGGGQSAPPISTSTQPPAAADTPSPVSDATESPVPLQQQPEPTPTPEVEHIHKVTLAAVGDVLIHSSIYKDAKTKDGYDFNPIFEQVKPHINKADLAIANLESMIGGEVLGLSDYPRFNAPFEVGDALQETGFDLVNLANNHTLDRGVKAIINSIEHLKKLGIEYTGAYSSEEDQQHIRIIQKNGISFAFLSYTYGTNGIPVPEDMPYLVNLIDNKRITQDITQARRLADVVILQLHYGQEYADMPNEQQKKLAHTAAEAGADIIIGHHPHVLQPMEWIETSSGRKSFVAYSIGNFIAAQDGKRHRIGGIVQLEINKIVRGASSRIELRSPSFLPTWIAMTNWRQYKILPLFHTPSQQLPHAKQTYEETQAHMQQWMPELSFIQE